MVLVFSGRQQASRSSCRHAHVSEATLNAFLSYANITEPNTFKGYTARLKLVIKATLARQLYGTQAYEMILHSQDPMIKKVLQLQQKSAGAEQLY